MSNLLVGLPDDLTIQEILPRLPWYVRPVCRAASKLWKATIDTCAENPDLQLLTRHHQLPLLTGSIVMATCEGNRNQYWEPQSSLLIKDLQGLRKLPPVNLFPGSPRFIFYSGKLYVWTLVGHKCWGSERDRIFKLDIAGGKWRWESFPVSRISSWFDTICHDGKIYASWEARHSYIGLDSVRLDVQVYDMETDSWRKIEKWPYSSIGASWDGVKDTGKLAGFTWSWELLCYEAGVWKPQLVVPPENWPSDAKFVCGDSFVNPVLTEGFTIVLLGRNYTTEQDYIKWYNTASSKSWSVIENPQETLATGLTLEKMQVVDGRLYGLCQDENKENNLYIMHGVIDVVRSKIVWTVYQEMETQKLQYWTVMKNR